MPTSSLNSEWRNPEEWAVIILLIFAILATIILF